MEKYQFILCIELVKAVWWAAAVVSLCVCVCVCVCVCLGEALSSVVVR